MHPEEFEDFTEPIIGLDKTYKILSILYLNSRPARDTIKTFKRVCKFGQHGVSLII